MVKKKSYPILAMALVGAAGGLVGEALLYLGERLAGLPFFPFDFFDWLARVLPGGLITFGIASMVKLITTLHLGPTAATAKLGEQALGLVLFVLIGAIFGTVLSWAGRRDSRRLVYYGPLGGLVLGLGSLFVESVLGWKQPASTGFSAFWLLAVFTLGGGLLGRVLHELAQTTVPVASVAPPLAPLAEVAPDSALPAEVPPVAAVPAEQAGMSRRQFLYLVGVGSAAVLVTAAGVRLLSRRNGGEVLSPTGPQGEPPLEPPPASNTAPPAGRAGRLAVAPGTRPELTDNADFYRIDINLRPPEVDGRTWRLEVKGLVDNPLSLSLDDLRAFPAYSQYITLECISNPVGGDLISSSYWTGARLKDVMAKAGLRPEAKEIAIKSADAFYESVNNQDIFDDRTLLVYEMNGDPLPVEHGYPLRIYIPNRHGMKQPKWITSLEAIDHDGSGYWVDRGWDLRAIPHTTSVIDAADTDQRDPASGAVPVGGIAYAGARGLSKVEVQVDGGAWEEAELRTPPLSSLTWVQWRYDWKATPGQHTLRVRATDGEGQLQEEDVNPPEPHGATGLDSTTVKV